MLSELHDWLSCEYGAIISMLLVADQVEPYKPLVQKIF
jgi:hypothetical protein